MKPHISLCTKRHTAFLMLLVWGVALASGVANACLLDAHDRHAHVIAAAVSGAVQVALASDDPLEVDAGHDDDGSDSGALCLKACDDSKHFVPKQTLKATQPDPGPAPLVTILWNVAVPAGSRPYQSNDFQRTPPERSIRLRFSRLAI
jgi:hypothetical protein